MSFTSDRPLRRVYKVHTMETEGGPPLSVKYDFDEALRVARCVGGWVVGPGGDLPWEYR